MLMRGTDNILDHERHLLQVIGDLRCYPISKNTGAGSLRQTEILCVFQKRGL